MIKIIKKPIKYFDIILFKKNVYNRVTKKKIIFQKLSYYYKIVKGSTSYKYNLFLSNYLKMLILLLKIKKEISYNILSKVGLTI